MKTVPEQFKHNSMQLLNIVIDMIEEGYQNKVVDINPMLVKTFLPPMISSLPEDKMVTNFINNTIPLNGTRNFEYWEKIREKDFNFFDNLADNLIEMFRGKGTGENDLMLEQAEKVKILLKSSYVNLEGQTVYILDKETKENIWEILHSLVILSIRYIHERRRYNPETNKYTEQFLPDIKVKDLATKWGIRKI